MKLSLSALAAGLDILKSVDCLSDVQNFCAKTLAIQVIREGRGLLQFLVKSVNVAEIIGEAQHLAGAKMAGMKAFNFGKRNGFTGEKVPERKRRMLGRPECRGGLLIIQVDHNQKLILRRLMAAKQDKIIAGAGLNELHAGLILKCRMRL